MKKNIQHFCLFLILSLQGYSQVQVGDGFVNDQNLPFKANIDYSYSQSIYLSSEINTSGTITSIKWYYTGSGSLPNNQQLVIYMGNTTKTVFSSNTDWEPITNLTMVYSGGITTGSTPGWKTLILTTPFVYNGTNNLIVAVDENQIGYDANTDKFYNTAVTGKRSISYISFYTDPNPTTPPVASSIESYIPNIIFSGITQSCPTPQYVATTNITSSSATISWQTPTVAPSGGSDYYVSTSSIPPTVTTIPTGNVATGNTFNLSALTAGTTYYVWVKNNCENSTYSNWSLTASFTTLCIPVVAFNQNFDEVIAPQLPNCWSKIIRGPSINAVGTVIETSSLANNQVFSAPNSVKLFNSNASTTTNDIILVTPNLSTLNLGTYRLKFYAKQLSTIGSIQIGTLNNNTNTAVFTPLPGYEILMITTASVEYTVNFTGYTGTDNYIGIRMNTGNNYTTILLDNIRWEPNPNCPDVTNVIVPVVNATSAKISWTPGSNETSWEVAVGLPSVTDPNTLTPQNSDSVTKVVTGLNSTTMYNVWVRPVCAVGGFGSWVGPVSFTTDCVAVAAFNENFDNVTVPQLPSCWSKIIRGDNINSTFTVVETSSSVASNVSSLPNAVKLSNSYAISTQSDIILVSPNLSTLGLGTHRLKFSAKQNVYINNNTPKIIVGTMNSATNLGIFTPLEIVDITIQANEYIVVFNNYSGTDTHIGLKMFAVDPNILIFVDNIVWEVNPTCPDVSLINVPTTTSTSATIAWSSNGNETAWQVAVGPTSVTDPNTLIPQDATTTTKVVTGLTSLTTYKVWVRSVCTGNNYGAWIGSVTFTTACPSVSTLNENFDTTTTPNLPQCWSKILRGLAPSPYSEVKTVGNQYYSASNAANIYNAVSSSNNDVILVTPSLSNINTGNYRLRFFAKHNPNGNPGSFQVGTLNGNTNAAEFNSIITYSTANTYTEYILEFNNSVGGTDTYIGFRMNSADASNIYIDDVIWEPIPLCPDPINAIVNSTTPTSGNVIWTASGIETSWNVAVGLATVTDPNTLTAVNTTTPSKNLTGLSPNTAYKVWIKSVCSLGNGLWVGPILFTTPCASINSINENFDAVVTPNLPTCWTKILRGTALSTTADVFTTTSSSYSLPNSVLMRNTNSGLDTDIILVSPTLSTTSLYPGTTYKLKFYSNSAAPIEVGTLDNNTKYATFTVHQLINPINSNYTQYIVPFNTYTGTNTYIGIRISSATTYNVVNIDNITFDADLTTNAFDLNQLSYYPNPVKNILNISYINDIDLVVVYNLLGQEVMTKSINENLAEIDMSALAKGTYIVKVATDNLIKTIKVIKQ